MKITEMTKDEKSLLLYFETRMVDGSGFVESARMNKTDFDNAAKWKASGFIQFGRIFARALAPRTGPVRRDHWVRLSPEAWALAHELRRERSAQWIAKADESICNGLS